MHLAYEARRLHVADIFRNANLRHELIARVISIFLHCKSGKGEQVYPISVFQHRLVVISHGNPYDIGYATVIAGSSSHPQYVMVAPLEIHIMITAKHVHNVMRSRSSVEYIAENVKRIYREPLDEIAHSYDKFIRTVYRYDGTHDAIHISLFVWSQRTLVQQFLYDIGKIFRQCLAYFGACVLR